MQRTLGEVEEAAKSYEYGSARPASSFARPEVLVFSRGSSGSSAAASGGATARGFEQPGMAPALSRARTPFLATIREKKHKNNAGICCPSALMPLIHLIGTNAAHAAAAPLAAEDLVLCATNELDELDDCDLRAAPPDALVLVLGKPQFAEVA